MLTKFNIFVIIIKQFATRTVPYAQIAQLVEQRTENPRVLGSIPSLGTVKKEKPSAERMRAFVYLGKKKGEF